MPNQDLRKFSREKVKASNYNNTFTKVNWQKYLKFLVINLSFLIIGCGGGSTTTSNTNTTTPLQGTAKLGNLADANVTIYRVEDNGTLTSLYTETTSSGTTLDKIGKFDMHVDALDNNTFYVYKVTGGKDWDANDDGKLDINGTVNKGTIRAIAKGSELKAIGNNFIVSYETELVYEEIVSNFKNKFNKNTFVTKLQNAIKKIIKDVNSNGNIDEKDMLTFNPQIDKSKLTLPYKQELKNIKDAILSGKTPPAPNHALKISIFANTQVNTRESFTIIADATDSDGAVSSIDWYDANGNKIGSGTSINLMENSAGTYTFYAIATDNDGATTQSSNIKVKVINNFQNISGGGYLTKIKINGNKISIGATNGILIHSDDGIHWTSELTGLKHSIDAIAYKNGIYVVGGYDGNIMCKKDGKWKITFSGYSKITGLINYKNNFYFSNNSGKIYKSSDCEDWKQIYNNDKSIVNLEKIKINNQEFMLVPKSNGNLLMFSEDDSYQEMQTGLDSISDIYIYNNNVYVSGGNKIAYKNFLSKNKWSIINTNLNGNIDRIAVSNDGIIATIPGTDQGVFFSKDLINWKKIDDICYSGNDVAYFKNNFIYTKNLDVLQRYNSKDKLFTSIQLIPMGIGFNYNKYNNKLYVISKFFSSTTDGYTWKNFYPINGKTLLEGYNSLAFDNKGDILMVGDNKHFVYIKNSDINYTDGTIKDFTEGELPNDIIDSSALWDVIWDGKKYVITSISHQDKIITTKDTSSWNTHQVPFQYAYKILKYNNCYYVASGKGLYKSFDLDNWEKIINEPVRDIKIDSDGTIYTVTHDDNGENNLIIIKNDGTVNSLTIINTDIYNAIFTLTVVQKDSKKEVFLDHHYDVYRVDIDENNISNSAIFKYENFLTYANNVQPRFITNMGNNIIDGSSHGISVYKYK